MNMLSTKFVTHSSPLTPGDLSDSVCTHVEAGPSLAYAVLKEDDSFGAVGRHVVCRSCYEDIKAEEDAELETCHDCSRQFPAGELASWRWFDFYAAQGDEPLRLCPSCLVAPQHEERRRRDRAEADAEHQAFDDEYDDGSDISPAVLAAEAARLEAYAKRLEEEFLLLRADLRLARDLGLKWEVKLYRTRAFHVCHKLLLLNRDDGIELPPSLRNRRVQRPHFSRFPYKAPA